jgi:hypothetical protein
VAASYCRCLATATYKHKRRSLPKDTGA